MNTFCEKKNKNVASKYEPDPRLIQIAWTFHRTMTSNRAVQQPHKHLNLMSPKKEKSIEREVIDKHYTSYVFKRSSLRHASHCEPRRFAKQWFQSILKAFQNYTFINSLKEFVYTRKFKSKIFTLGPGSVHPTPQNFQTLF